MAYFTLPHKHTALNNEKEDKPLLSEDSYTQYQSTTSIVSSDNLSRSSPLSQNTTTTSSTSSCTTPPDGVDIKPINRLAHLRRSNWSIPSTDPPTINNNNNNNNNSSNNSRCSSSNSNINSSRYEDIYTPLQIPSFQLYNTNNTNNNNNLYIKREKDAITHEIDLYITFGIITSLLCPFLSTILVFKAQHAGHSIWIQQSLQPLLLVTWCLLFVLWQHRPKRMKLFLLCVQLINIMTLITIALIPTMFIILPEFVYFLTSCLLLSLGLFYLGRRLNRANQQLHLSFQQRVTNHYSLVQRHLQDQSFSHTQRHLSFLSTISNEIQDAAIMVMATLEQFSPSMILANSNELLSACSIAVPISSIAAINTTIKQVCHISSHLQLMSCFIQASHSNDSLSSITTATSSLSSNDHQQQQQQQLLLLQQSTIRSPIQQMFDIGELLQNIGDALAGIASKLDVNFVIYHWDNTLHHKKVSGDEAAVRHALLNLIRNVLESCTPGACVELGLNSTTNKNNTSKTCVTFEVIHIPSPCLPAHLLSDPILSETHITKQLIQYAGGSLSVHSLPKHKTRFEIIIELETTNTSNHSLHDHPHPFFIKNSSNATTATAPPTQLQKAFNHIKFANEPTLKELMKFMETLKGLKMVLHAKEQSMFAKHLTGCLASWNTDISHAPVSQLDNEDIVNDLHTPGSDSNASVDTSSMEGPNPLPSPRYFNNNLHHNGQQQQQQQVPSPAIAEEQLHSIPPAFILIDDHVVTLEQKLIEFRTHTPISATVLQNGRRHKHSKSASSIHHHHHNPHHPSSHHGTTTAIIHFTSLNNYKRVRDTIQWVATLPMPYAMPRIVVVPKPAGPRRYLTALHTAWHNAMVKPHFIPIATSPTSPLPTLIPSFLTTSSDAISTPSSTSSRTPPTPNHHHPMSAGPFTVSHFDYGRTNDMASNGNNNNNNGRSRRNINMHHFTLQQHEPNSYFFDRTGNANPSLPFTSPSNNNNNNNNRIRRRSHNNETTTATAFDFMTTGHQPSNNNSEFMKAINYNFPQMVSPLAKADRSNKLLSSKEYINPAISPLEPSPPTGNDDNDDHCSISTTNKNDDKPQLLTCNTSPTILPPNDEGTIVTTSPQELIHSSILNTKKERNNNDDHSISTSSPHPHSITPPPQPHSSLNNTAPNEHHHSPSLPSPPLPQSQSQSQLQQQTENKPKIVSKMTSIKMNNKKKKKDKGTPFSNAVSPPINVLIVEDNIINQAILSAWMKKHKIQFSVASDGKEAVEKWKGGGFHLILMDIQLPVMNGLEATKTIRSIEKEQKIGVLPMSSFFLRQQQQQQQGLSTIGETNEMESLSSPNSVHKLPFSPTEDSNCNNNSNNLDTSQLAPSTFRSPVIIVALTASSLESDRHAALAAGCNDFLTKPVSLEWLEKKIIEWGCMQALIDFEGWRRWKQSSTHDGDHSSSTPPSSSATATAITNTMTKGQQQQGGMNQHSDHLINKNSTSSSSSSTITSIPQLSNKLLAISTSSSVSALNSSSIINKSSISLARRLSYFNAHYMAKMKRQGSGSGDEEDNNNKNGLLSSDYNASPLSHSINLSSSTVSDTHATSTKTTTRSLSLHEGMPSKYYEEMNDFINQHHPNNMKQNYHPLSPSSTSSSILSVVKNPFNGQKGLLLPGAVGLSKRRYSTMEKPSSMRKNSSAMAQVTRTISLNRLPIQKSLSESTNTQGVKKKPSSTTKKAVSMDDTSIRSSSLNSPSCDDVKS
ncbi:hypothetical protein BJ944DRAFT_243960 [Cunninghamella echinulata]|nr:hypothetical protein BJ944DRAFT_243960 [Cunninghamella echinulata]